MNMVQEVIVGPAVEQYEVVEISNYDPDNGFSIKYSFQKHLEPLHKNSLDNGKVIAWSFTPKKNE